MTAKIMTPYNLVGDHHNLKVKPGGYPETLISTYNRRQEYKHVGGTIFPCKDLKHN
jgi:hypothetical protein